MSDITPKTKKAFVIRDFADAGTDEIHLAGTTPQIEIGIFANYEAAGLVRVATAEDNKATKPAA